MDTQKQRGIKVFRLCQPAVQRGGIVVGVQQIDLRSPVLQLLCDGFGKLPVDSLFRPVRVDVVRYTRVAASMSRVHGDARTLDAGRVIKAQHDVSIFMVGFVPQKAAVVQKLQCQGAASPACTGKQRVFIEG